MAFHHEGISELDFKHGDLYFKLQLPELTAAQIEVGVPATDAVHLDSGYILQRQGSQELIQIQHFKTLGGAPVPYQFQMVLCRGYNRTQPEHHPADDWMVVSVPHVDFTPRNRAHPWKCDVCGGPNDEPVCRWCKQGSAPL